MTRSGVLALVFVAVALLHAVANAAPRITLSGPAQVGPIAADAEGRFAFPNVALRKNSVNVFTVTATDDLGNMVTRTVSITQLSLESVVVARISATPLSVQEIQQLVNDGAIKLDDPENFNVSRFVIVLTIGQQPVPIDVPIVLPKGETGFETIRLPRDSGPSSGGIPKPQDIEIVVFDEPVSGDQPLSVPGVLIIEGRIKTLKEFYSVRLLLMNTSGIFTLKDVKATIEFPNGGLSHTLPADGLASFGDILPGTPDQPGQAEREFIIRGDEIGVRPVKVNFGGLVVGPGIPEDGPIPFNGSAQTTVEVKGPPSFQVQVKHPPFVVATIPYELTIDITNTGETPALYASLELDVGADARLVTCRIEEGTGLPLCDPIEGPSVRNLGHIFPGRTVSETFTVEPLKSGLITSCMGIADQNISLQVLVGNIGCLVGRFPPETGVPDGIPTVTVLPFANALGVGIDSPVTAFFSEQMSIATITTDSLRVVEANGRVVPGQIRFETIFDRTVAIWQVNDGITNRLTPNTEHTVFLTQDIRDLQGNALANPWQSQFTTTSPVDDQTPPTLTLSVEPPVDPNLVLPGQIVRINAYASDQGTGVARVELRRLDAGTPGALFELVDQKTVFPTSVGPCIFSIDSAKLVPGRTYQFKATAYDKAGNAQDATIAVIMAAGAAPPTIRLPDDPAAPVLQGISVSLTPLEVSAGVRAVNLFLDDALTPFRTLTLPPFQTALSTLNLPLGPHTVRAVAVDGMGQTGEDTFGFTVTANTTRPVVNFGSAVDGAQYVVGSVFPVVGNASDPVGIDSVRFFLDQVNGSPLATGTQPFSVSTANLALGPHRIIIVATNKLGLTNDVNDPVSILEFEIVPVPSGSAPAPPTLDPLAPPVNGRVTVQGTAASSARIDITNMTLGFSLSVFANGAGAFSAVIDANVGDVIQAVALVLTQSQQPSPVTSAVVPAPPVLDRVEVTPTSFTLTALNAFGDLAVTGFFTNGSTANLTGSATFSSSNLAVASVNAAGRVVAVASGEAAITAQVNGKQAQATVTVSIRTLVSIALDPSSFTLFGPGKTRQLAVVGTFSDTTTSPIGAGVAFGSSNTGVVTVNAGGLVTSTGFGGAVISAAVSGLPPAQSLVTVAAIEPTGITASPSSILFTAEGETRQLLVSRTLSDGTTETAPPPVEFETSDSNVATAGPSGLVTAVANGSATITVRHAGFQATVPVTVDIPTVVLPPPVIASLDRPRAAEGDLFTIRGQNFAALPGENVVTVNGVAAEVRSARQDELTAVVPPGATTGPVVVTVAGRASNEGALTVYPRRARSFEITAAVDTPAAPGQRLMFEFADIDVRAGDRVFLSSAPDVLAPLSFAGSLFAAVDGGPEFPVPLAATATDLTAAFTPGLHTLSLDLTESGERFRTGPIFLVVGPDATGPIAGERFVTGLAQSRPIPVTVIELTDLNGALLPDGSKVAVTVLQIGVSPPEGPCCVTSAGGTIVNGDGTSPNDGRFRFFTVLGGRIDVVYDPLGAAGLSTGTDAVASIQVLPADANGNRVGFQAIAVEPVTLTTYDTAATPRSQSAAIADGAPKIVTIALTGIRDTAGNLVPDGARVAVTALQIGVSPPEGPCCVNSAGGTIVNGDGTSPNDGRFKVFTLTNGRVDIQYDTGSVVLAVGDVRVANVQVLPADAAGSRIGFTAFAVVPVTLSSPSVAPANVTVVPGSVLADGGDNRVVVTLTNVVDAAGSPVPDGTDVAVTALQIGVSAPDGTCCVNSAGGSIVNSAVSSPNDGRFRVLTIQGGRVDIVYSTAGAVKLEARQSSVARVQVLPADAAGSRIGFRAMAVADVTLTGMDAATGVANPPSAVADGRPKTVTVTLTSIRDTAGNLVPDGARVAVTAGQIGVSPPDGPCCVNSAGGSIVNGEGTSPNDGRFRFFTIAGGRVDIHYDPGSVLLDAGTVAIANVQVLPADPLGSRIGFRAFSVVPVTLSSASVPAANVSVVPTSVLADGGDNQVTVTLTGIVDALGNSVPDGTKVAVTAGQIGVSAPDGTCCVNSAGGSIANSAVSSPNDGRFRVLTIQGGQVQIVYSAQGATKLETRQSTTARVQVLPADAAGNRIGFRAFAVADVALTGYFSASVSGPGTLAPGAQATYVASSILDTAGNPVPDGARVAVTTLQIGVTAPDGTCCVNSTGGTILNGEGAALNDGRFTLFTVQGGSISIDFQAPVTAGTSVIQLLPADPAGNRIGFRAFAVKSVAIEP